MKIEKCETCINRRTMYASGGFRFPGCNVNLCMPIWDVEENKCKYETNDFLKWLYKLDESFGEEE